MEKILSENVFFDNLSLVEAANRIRSLASLPGFAYVVTPNIDHLARLSGSNADNQLQRIYREASLSLCDSRIVDKLLRMKGKQVKEVVPGSSLTVYLFDHVLQPADRILVLGVEEQYIAQLRQRYPKLTIEHINPSMGFIKKEEEVSELLNQIETMSPDFIFLSVGSPRQEILADKIKQQVSINSVGLCVGASVLFLVDAEKRAPEFLQKLHLEWAYRMLQNPQRLVKRYFGNFLALPAVFREL